MVDGLFLHTLLPARLLPPLLLVSLSFLALLQSTVRFISPLYSDFILFDEVSVIDGDNISPYPGKGHLTPNNGGGRSWNSNSNNSSAGTLIAGTLRYSIKHTVNNPRSPRYGILYDFEPYQVYVD